MEHSKLLNMGAELGQVLMTSGAEIYRVEESVERLLTAYGLQPQVFALPNCLIVSVNTPAGQPITRMCRIPAHGTDIELLERCNQLCRRLCQNPLPVDKACELLDMVAVEARRFSARVVLGGYTVVGAFFSLFHGGAAGDGLCGALCGLLIGLCLLFGKRLTGSNLFFRTAVCSSLAASLAALLDWLGVGQI